MLSALLLSVFDSPGITSVMGFLLGACLVAVLSQIISRIRSRTFKEDLERQIVGAKKEAENIIKAATIDAAEQAIKKKEKFGEGPRSIP